MSASAKGITLEQGTVVVLSYDGTLVYVEDIQPMWAAVIALPEQPDTRKADSIVFTPGAVRAKKISPYSALDKVVTLGDLSDKNREFITLYPTLRDDRGANFIFGKVEPVPVKKVKPSEVADPLGEAKPRRGSLSRAEKQAARRAKRAAARADACATCGKQKADPVHDQKFIDKYDHDFAAPAGPSPRGSGTRERDRGAAKPSNGATRYTLVSEDLTAAQAQPKGERYAEGNRFFRVVRVLAALPDKTGTAEDIIAGLLTDGGKIPTDPAKVVKRCLSQITTPAFGSLVTVA